MPRLLCLFLLLSTSSAFSFGLHYLVTDRALSGVDGLDGQLATEPLPDFLSAEKTKVAQLFVDYYAWLKARGEKRFLPQIFDTEHPDIAAFLKAARLNPQARIRYLVRDLPNAAPPKAPAIRLAEISFYEREEAGVRYFFRDTTGQKISPRAILTTFSDEPDWGMDNDLWSHPEFGYGKQPYGKPQGLTTQAPFHCQYSHENLIVRLAAPEVTQGMVPERLELAQRLAHLAFATKHPYWGYRFTAWAIHYLEDGGQPYHTRAVPFADWRYYLKFVFSLRKKEMKAEATQITINHHDLYEDFVKLLLQGTYTGGDDTRGQAFVQAMAERGAEWSEKDGQAIYAKMIAWSSSYATELDRAVMSGFELPGAQDPHYDLEADPAYQPSEAPHYATGLKAQPLVEFATEDLRQVARAVRALLAVAQ